jgi:hypothetical protein
VTGASVIGHGHELVCNWKRFAKSAVTPATTACHTGITLHKTMDVVLKILETIKHVQQD